MSTDNLQGMDKGATKAKEDIPAFDFSLLTDGTPDERSRIIRDIGRACEEWGCFSLLNHGVPERLQTAMMEALDSFLDLPVEDREEYIGRGVFDPIRHGTGFATTPEGYEYTRDFVRIFVNPTLHTPAKPLHFREICEEYSRQTREISHKLLIAIGESLGLEEDYMEEAWNATEGHQILVGNRYDRRRLPEEALGLPTHSDTPFLAVVIENVPGLQVLHDGEWIPVNFIPGSLFIHTGDLLEIVSNGRYKSLLHRAMLSNESTRMSVVSALGMPTERVVEPAPKLVQFDNRAAFPGMKYIEFVELTKSHSQFEKQAINLIKL